MNILKKAFQFIQSTYNKMTRKTEKDVIQQYVNLLSNIRKEMALLFEKYEVEGKLTYAEMAKYHRLEEYFRKTEYTIDTHYKGLKKTIFKSLSKAYENAYYETAKGIQEAIEQDLQYSSVPHEVITAAIELPIEGLTLSQRLEKQRNNIVFTIKDTVTRGLVEGQTYATMAKNLKKVVEIDAAKSTRIVRTEAHRANETGKQDSAKYANSVGVITVKEWNSSKDERVRDRIEASHKELDGTTIPLDENFSQSGASGKGPGMMGSAAHDINCRCFLTYSIKDIEKSDNVELYTEYGYNDNKEVRQWYIERDKNIINVIDKSKSIKQQAMQACSLRNQYRSEARLMMSDRKSAEKLEAEQPNKSFEELVKDKQKRKGLTLEQAYQDIVDTAGKTNAKVNKKLNL
ncbi:phage minor head protein [Bacillus sp. JJ722]|uniref:phage minor head protein n=1 Tax=Bacillus sp. JJ722 TaxID=3122973 RepID=UPI003000F921